MSDYLLKFWPKEDTIADKTIEIEKELTEAKITGAKIDFWGKPAFKAGNIINEFLAPKLERANPYFDTIAITIEAKNYGVIEGAEDFEYIDRRNVISIKGGEGAFNTWHLMCEKLNAITGDEYQGGWELL
ncbi:hypothetical protein Celal_3212 [Cellulophaga algicola DSM 14237]|uniref:Uncharacterized protein n=1 Tax=Cellulophaga algicola (strain DSM 14237 / IC166 / ACAM 630) TaxID=688270 RepID=E6X4Z1_CELAD|nr:hypothetical protein [Cellulophaga algicola]ADV50483.1 hypothetical protein Celal_3212 [Cellulophaga algicola DSM 14237]